MDLTSIVNIISAIVIGILTFLIWRATQAQAETTDALRAIETQRDFAEDPRVFICIDGYHPDTQVASFVMQNSGKKSLFLRSLQIYSSGMEVEMFNMEMGSKNDRMMVPRQEIRDLVITPDKTEKFYFKLNGSGQHFELLAQLYTGNPVRLKMNPSYYNGYELRAIGGTELKAYFKGRELNKNGDAS